MLKEGYQISLRGRSVNVQTAMTEGRKRGEKNCKTHVAKVKLKKKME